MAHNNFYILDKLLRLLDDSRNDIYLHIDKKVKDFHFDQFRAACRDATVYYPPRRIDVQWGTQSQVLTEMLLFKMAYSNGPYHYYHFISGTDLPLKTQDEMHTFFDRRTESFLFYHSEPTAYDLMRISRYRNVFGNRTRLARKLSVAADHIQMRLKVDRLKNCKWTIKRGWNWTSLPQNAVETLLQKEREIRKTTRFSVCADEMYKQIILLNSDCPIYINNEGKPDCLRFVDWSAGGNHPHTFTMNDFDRLIASDKLFARKFDENVDREVVDRLFEYIMERQRAERK